MNKFDHALEALARTRATGVSLPVNVTVGGAVFETNAFLQLFRHDRRKAWASLAAIGENSTKREDSFVCEIALSLA